MGKLSRSQTVCVTGHRPQHFGTFDESSPLIVEIKEKIRAELKALYKEGFRNFISGMALGVDQWFAEAVLELRKKHDDVNLVCAIPCLNHPAKWNSSAKKRWQDIVDSTPYVCYVTKEEYTGACMQKRNEWMVDRSTIVLAVWDGKKSGGTFNCVKYACQQAKKIRQINPKELAVNV